MACSSGEEAIGYYTKTWEHIDLVILDMVMPKMGGRDVFAAMRRVNPNIKALLASGYGLDGEAQSILDSGVLGFIQKPFRMTELSRKVAEVLRGA
jgi:CheY-like chemotaxis protein